MLLLTSTLHHSIESNGGSLNQRERVSQTSLPPVTLTEVSNCRASDDFIKISDVCAADLRTAQTETRGPAFSASTSASVTGTGLISTSSVIPLSLAGNDLIILQMNRDINLFHKHFLRELIKKCLGGADRE